MAMFDSVLIANRGEIACRIIRTARRMGLRTIAVYSDADRDALHVQMADQAVPIGPAPATESYLRPDRILEAAKATGAAAIHPGYGFLSEQPDLVNGCTKNGIVWIGPHLDAILSMGSKIEAKAIAERNGVPCIPGYSGADQSDEALIAAAREIGFPVMVKASAGGGGKGMRAVFDPIDLAGAITSARTEAERSFGDGRLLIEKLILNPRHIELQLLGDKHGNLIHLFERDCSVQRNHQKLLEEAPAPNLDDETRTRLFRSAISLGKAIGYDSAGTVEFVMNAETGDFYFLEMNTRLQVEHTVTEEITGIDLVEMQLRMAAGETLPFSQDEIACTGHAIEARLTAEDAADGFRPETGEVLHWRIDPGLRCDTGIQAGSTIGASYDSMIAKLIAHGPDREAACRKLVSGLNGLEIAGLTTNRLFLRDAIRSERFASGRATTNFLVQEWPNGWSPETTVDSLPYAALACHLRDRPAASPWQSLAGFRLLSQAGHPARTTYVDAEAPEHRVEITGQSGAYTVTCNGTTETVSAAWQDPVTLRLTRNGVSETVGAIHRDGATYVWGPGFDAKHRIVPAGDFNPAHHNGTAAAPDRITAPIPGLLVNVNVRPGDTVAEGDTLVVMESMKLLMDLKAAATGTVATVGAVPGTTVEAGALLVQLDLTES
ncbi:acetyl/propionyl/methylcrotonyl-CoA carboxylase subunit alpha [Roseibium sp.]|uniref:acetyl/propionyl/methylcrotonyl-CoA carboxylase subunit alpha n=1 Tax=Roseibium sp. TaxID=1936156 RepID=UPI003A97A178